MLHNDCTGQINQMPDGTLACKDLLHVVVSMDPDDPGDGPVVWNVLPNHAEFEKVLPAIREYADETEGVEDIYVEYARAASGDEMAASVRADIDELRVEAD